MRLSTAFVFLVAGLLALGALIAWSSGVSHPWVILAATWIVVLAGANLFMVFSDRYEPS